MTQKNYFLIITVILIIGSIYYIQSNKPDFSEVEVIVEEDGKLIAPELQGIKGYINTDNITIKEHKGKVVLIDIWTYSCINCIRTLPFLKSWHEKYKDKGLVIIGVHSPEFDFEKKYSNVQLAVDKYGIEYPIVLDNDFKTWTAYKNSYWPRKYLIDQDGYIVYDHIGEGAYEETEQKIQELLNLDMELTSTQDDIQRRINLGSPEMYFGYKFRRGNFGQFVFTPDETTTYEIPDIKIPLNQVFLEGDWLYKEDYMELTSDEGRILLFYRAKNVNIVSSSNPKIKLEVKLDDNYLTSEEIGSDVVIKNGKSISEVNEEVLYNVVSDVNYAKRVLELKAKKGFRIYTFTFG